MQRVSDDDYWKDFRRDLNTTTPRLLLSDIQATRPFGEWTTYARAHALAGSPERRQPDRRAL